MPGHERGRIDVFDLVDDQALAADDPAPAHVEHLDARFERVLFDAEEVEVLLAARDHLLALDRLAHARELVADARRELELELRRRRRSSACRAASAPRRARRRGSRATRRRACRTPRGRSRRRTAPRTSRCGRRGTAGRADGADRTSTSCTSGSGTSAAGGRASPGSRTHARTDRSSARPCASAPRSTIARGHSSSRVTARYGYDLSSFSRMLKRGRCCLMRLNSRKNASTSFAGDDPLDPLGGQHHLPRAFLEQMGLEEVVREPGPQALGLPDVDDPALGVEELVRARCVGDRADFGTGDHAPFSRARGARECFHSD